MQKKKIVKPYLKPDLAGSCERFWEGLGCLLDLGFHLFFLLPVRAHYSGHMMAKTKRCAEPEGRSLCTKID